MGAAWLMLTANLYPATVIWAAAPRTCSAELLTCPFEQVVGHIRNIAGDVQSVHLHRGNCEVPATLHVCLRYGDVLEVGIQSTVIIDTAEGRHYVGDDSDPIWKAPQARETVSPDVSALLTTLYDGWFGRAESQTAPIVGRGAHSCPPPQTPSTPLTSLGRLRQTDQQIGTDLRAVVAAWMPSREPRKVKARLLSVDGKVIAEEPICLNAHVILPVPPGTLHIGNRLTLDISDDSGQILRYNLLVVDPTQLAQPPIEFHQEWLLAAWRLTAGPPEERLDAISRLRMTEPSDSLGARLLLEAVWTDAPF
jgi:hypothetical protein